MFNGSLNIDSLNSAFEKLSDLLDLRIFGFVKIIENLKIDLLNILVPS